MQTLNKVDEICKIIGEQKLESLLDKKLDYIKSKVTQYEFQLQERDSLIEQMKLSNRPLSKNQDSKVL